MDYVWQTEKYCTRCKTRTIWKETGETTTFGQQQEPLIGCTKYSN